MGIFLHSIAPLKVVDHILRKVSECTIQLHWFQNILNSSNFQNTASNSTRMHHLASLLSHFSQQFQLPKHRFKQRQNAPFCVLAFKVSPAVPSSRPSIQIPPESTIYRPWFQNVVIIFNFQKHRSKCARMHRLVSLVSKLSHQCQLWFIGQVMSKHIVICEHTLQFLLCMYSTCRSY